MPATPRPSTSRSSTSSDVSTTTHGLRSQLGQLLPKHALFQVRLHIDQLSNVPLISGQFAVRWKFKNVHSGSGFLAKMKARRSRSATRSKGKGKERAVEPTIEVTAEDGSGHSADIDAYSSAHEDDTPDPLSLSAPDPDMSSGLYGEFLTASPPSTPMLTPVPLRTDSSSSVQSQSESRGMTPWAPLKSYNVKWQYSVNVIVQMDVHRETSDLLPSELKLVVMQVRCLLSVLCPCLTPLAGVARYSRRPRFASPTAARRGVPQPGRICRRGARNSAVSLATKQDECHAQGAQSRFEVTHVSHCDY